MFPLQQFKTFIKTNALFTSKDKILLAVSGGKDSVLMAHLFKLAGYQFSIAHCNFNLRIDEAQRDESFVKLLAATLNVPFYVNHFETKKYALAQQISTQMAARDLRYQWFNTLSIKNGYSYIAVAHHQNDSIETILLNLTRGTGISGMHGILPKRENIIRPLLFLSRLQIDEIIEKENIDYVEDSSNKSTNYARNKIRLNVIPHLRELNPKLEQTFVENIERFAATEEVLLEVVKQLREKIFIVEDDYVYLPIVAINSLKPQKLLLFELLRPFNFSAIVINEILTNLFKQSGTSFYSETHRATINRAHVLISPIKIYNADEHFLMHVADKSVTINNQQIALYKCDDLKIEPNANKAFVDFELLIFPLIIRFKQNSDKFMPLGMRNFKKVSDFFIDNKVPLPQKETIPIIVNGNGEIIWIAGFRQDNRYKVTTTTKKMAIFELSK